MIDLMQLYQNWICNHNHYCNFYW